MSRQVSLFAALMLSLLLVGCGMFGGVTPTPTPWVVIVTATPGGPGPQPEMSGDPIPADLLTGPCDHLLWPLRDGAVWRYSMTRGSEVREVSLSSAILPEGLVMRFDNQASLLTCLEGAVAGLPPSPLSGHPDLGAGLTGSNPVGDFLADASLLTPFGTAQTWDEELTPGGTVRLPSLDQGAALNVTGGKIVLVSTSAPLESITVPAGTYNTLPIDQQGFYDLRVNLPDGQEASVLIALTQRLYLAEGIGPVRIVFNGGTISTQGGTFELPGGITLELVDAALPR